MVEAGELTGALAEATVAASLAALLGERDADGSEPVPIEPVPFESTAKPSWTSR